MSSIATWASDRVRSAFLAAVLAAASGLLHAQDPAEVGKPYVESGDCWAYRAQGLQNREPVDAYEECITFVNREKNVIVAVATIEGKDREIETSYTSEWATIVGVDGLIMPGGGRIFQFPLRVGDRFTVDNEFKLAVLGEFAGRVRYEVQVVRWEDVTVPAGTFRALRIEARGTVRRYDINSSGPVQTTYWYAPKVQRWVKQQFETKVRAYSRELVKYRLNQ